MATNTLLRLIDLDPSITKARIDYVKFLIYIKTAEDYTKLTVIRTRNTKSSMKFKKSIYI